MKNPIVAVSLVLTLCFVFGCQNKAEKAELEEFRAQARIEEQNMALYRQEIDALNKGNVEFLREVNAPDYVYHFPSANPKTMGTDEVIAMIRGNLEGFPDARWTLEEQVAAGDVVVSRLVVRSTNTASYQGMPATGNTVEFSSLNWCRMKDGKIVEEREEVDIFGFMQQLGMELKPKEAETN